MMAKDRSIETLAPHLVLADGSPIPFEEQVAAYAYGEMPTGDMFVVSTNAAEAGVPEAGALPILMKQKTMRKVQADHEITLAKIEKLPIWLEEHPLAMESITEENGLVVVADAHDKRGNDIIVAMHLGVERQRVEIDEIASVYGKRNLAYLIENTASLGKGIYANERTGDWILRTGLQLPEQIANRLRHQYTPARTGEQRALDLLMDGTDFYRPEDGAFLDSLLNEAEEPELIVYDAPLHQIKEAVELLRSEGIEYGDGLIAPFELVSGESPIDVDFDAMRLSLSRDFAAIKDFAADIASGRWVRAGADIDSLIERSERLLAQAAPRCGAPASLRGQGSKCELAAGQIDRERGERGPLSRDSDARAGGARA